LSESGREVKGWRHDLKSIEKDSSAYSAPEQRNPKS